MSGFGFGSIILAPAALTSFSALASFVIDAANHKIAYRFFAAATSQITHVDVFLNAVGNTSGCTFKMRIETDNAGIPSGTVLGAATAGFAGPSASNSDWWAGGGTNPIALGSATGALTLNTPYWLVLYEDGTDPDASNYIQAKRSYLTYDRESVKLDDGSGVWTHATAITQIGAYILKHENGQYFGSSVMTTTTPVDYTNIYDANKQAAKFRFGSQVKIYGFHVSFGKAGSPTNLIMKLYEGTTLKESVEIVAANVGSGNAMKIYLSTPCLLAADTNIYVVFLQKGTDETDGGDASNYYRFSLFSCHPTYYVNSFPEYPRVVYGTSTDPSALTEAPNTHRNIPVCFPMVSDYMDGLDFSAGGGGRPAFGDRNGGKF